MSVAIDVFADHHMAYATLSTGGGSGDPLVDPWGGSAARRAGTAPLSSGYDIWCLLFPGMRDGWPPVGPSGIDAGGADATPTRPTDV